MASIDEIVARLRGLDSLSVEAINKVRVACAMLAQAGATCEQIHGLASQIQGGGSISATVAQLQQQSAQAMGLIRGTAQPLVASQQLLISVKDKAGEASFNVRR